MFEIIEKQNLNATTTKMLIYAPLLAKKAQAGQFVILQAEAGGERIPLTLAGWNKEAGVVTVIFQVVGATTAVLNSLEVGAALPSFVGPLGNATNTGGVNRAAVIGGGVGCAIALPLAQQLANHGAYVDAITGFKTKELVILETEFAAAAARHTLVTDDGTHGQKGLVTTALKVYLDSGDKYDEVFAIGPLPMMKFVAQLTKGYGVKTTVSMNPIMIDGTGMCGCCRLTVGGQVKFACVDGPEFDAHLVDFDEAIARSSAYRSFEQKRHEETCNLLLKGVR